MIINIQFSKKKSCGIIKLHNENLNAHNNAIQHNKKVVEDRNISLGKNNANINKIKHHFMVYDNVVQVDRNKSMGSL